MQPLYQAEFSGRYLDAYGSAFGALPLAAQYGFAIVFGLVIGSFLTVVVHRLPIMLERAWKAENAIESEDDVHKHAPPARYNLAVPRSACPHCGHVLRAWENIPVVSYVLLRGRCAKCNARVSVRYPLTELATALFAALSLFAFGPTLIALAAFGLCATLLAASLIDFDTRYLPDTLTLPLLWAGLIVNLGDTAFVPLREAVIGAIAGYLFLWCVYWLFRLVRGVEGMVTAISSCSARWAHGSAGKRCRRWCWCRRWRARSSDWRQRVSARCGLKNRCRSGRFSRQAA